MASNNGTSASPTQASPSTPSPSPSPSESPSPSPSPSPSSAESSPVPPSSSASPPTTLPSSSESSESPSSSNPPSTSASSSQPPSSSPSPSSSPPPASTTQTITAQTTTPTKTELETSTSIYTPSQTNPTEIPSPSTVVKTITKDPAQPTSSGTQAAPASSSTNGANPELQGNREGSNNGLSPGGKTAVAVVVPVVVVALLLLAGIFLWRKRKQRKTAEEARRKEVEEYGFNPNDDPTLPAVGVATEMAEDQSGYRGWGNTATSSNRKASTTLTSGMTYSDSNSNPGGYASPGSPTHAYSDAHSGDPLVNGRRETMDSDGIGALGNGPAAQAQNGVHRGPSNASSSYSAADRSDNSGDYPIPVNNPHDYYDNNGYYQAGPYDNGYGAGQQPVIRDVSARRNTRIENPSVFPQQGNSGIAQNF